VTVKASPKPRARSRLAVLGVCAFVPRASFVTEFADRSARALVVLAVLVAHGGFGWILDCVHV
jgi:hypothetical protein